MLAQYHQFGADTQSSIHPEHYSHTGTGMKKVVMYILYSFLVVLLLILLIITGIKFSQLNKEITDVKLQLKHFKFGDAISPSGHAPVQPEEVQLEMIVPVRGSCREGWWHFQSSCYLFSRSAVSWQNAADQCQTLQAHLVVFNSVEELDYISRIVDYKYEFWIGLVERHQEGDWSWVDGTDIESTPTFWDIGQPDNWDYTENGEDCGQIPGSQKRKRKMWNDADCALLYRFICESKV